MWEPKESHCSAPGILERTPMARSLAVRGLSGGGGGGGGGEVGGSRGSSRSLLGWAHSGSGAA